MHDSHVLKEDGGKGSVSGVYWTGCTDLVVSHRLYSQTSRGKDRVEIYIPILYTNRSFASIHSWAGQCSAAMVERRSHRYFDQPTQIFFFLGSWHGWHSRPGGVHVSHKHFLACRSTLYLYMSVQ